MTGGSAAATSGAPAVAFFQYGPLCSLILRSPFRTERQCRPQHPRLEKAFRARPQPGYRYVAVSRPGYLGTPLRSGRSPQEQADVFAAALDALGIGTTAVMAVSGGGPSAIEFALRQKECCWGVVLVSGPGSLNSCGSTRRATSGSPNGLT